MRVGVLGLLIATGVLVGCDGGGEVPDISAPDVALPDVTLPDVTLPDVTLPDVDTPDADSSGPDSDGSAGGSDETGAGDGDPPPATEGETGDANGSGEATDDGTDPFALIAIVAILLGGAVLALSARAAARRRDEDRRRHDLELTQRASQLVRTSRWADGQARAAVDSDRPSRLTDAIATVTPYLVDAESESVSLASSTDADVGVEIEHVGHRLAALRGALEAFVHTAVRHDDDPAALAGGRELVERRRAELELAADQLHRTLSGVPR